LNRRTLLGGVGFFAFFIALTYSFLTNGFGVAPWNEWAVWEQGSDIMVLKRIEMDILNRDVSVLGLAAYEGDELSVLERLQPGNISNLAYTAPTEFIPYESEIGGQAHFLSFVWRDLGCSSISCLRAVNSTLAAATTLVLFLGFIRMGAVGLAVAWLISQFASPWITFGARNLFWSPWIYFLPAIAAIGLVLAKSRRSRLIAILAVFSAFAFKYVMTGYHEISAFIMLAAAMPVVHLLFAPNSSHNEIIRQLKNSVMVLIAGVVSFVIVLAFHAQLLTGNVMSGVNQIWVNAVLRRSYGDVLSADSTLSNPSPQNPVGVLWRYMWSDWWTDLLGFGINRDGNILSWSLGSASFMFLTVLCVGVVLIRYIRKDKSWIRDSLLLIIGFSIPAFWLMGAKNYAAAHPHILFFPWYWFYIPVLLYVTVSFIKDFGSLILAWLGISNKDELIPLTGKSGDQIAKS